MSDVTGLQSSVNEVTRNKSDFSFGFEALDLILSERVFLALLPSNIILAIRVT